jgi:acyl dehydratase
LPSPLTFEDFPVGRTFDLGVKDVLESEVLEFARAYDPQPFHLDRAAAQKSILGGLSASGWHTCAMLMRMIFDAYLKDTASLGSPGLEQVRWRRPVLAGDRLTGTSRVIEARRSSSRPGLGILRIVHELKNQNDEVVIVWDGTQFVATAASVAAGGAA